TRRTGVIWLAAPGGDRPAPAWHIWRDPPGAAYVVTGPGEQPLPGGAGADRGPGTRPSKGPGRGRGTRAARGHRGGAARRAWGGVRGVGRGHRPAGGCPAQRRPGPRVRGRPPARAGAFWRLTWSWHPRPIVHQGTS